jgi:hypothetical protein
VPIFLSQTGIAGGGASAPRAADARVAPPEINESARQYRATVQEAFILIPPLIEPRDGRTPLGVYALAKAKALMMLL